MCSDDVDRIEEILARIVARNDGRIAIVPIYVAEEALSEIQHFPHLMRRAALSGLRSRAREMIGMGPRVETIADGARRLRKRGRNL